MARNIKLTDRQLQITKAFSHGMTTKEIAFSMGQSINAVQLVLGRAKKKFNCKDKTQLVAECLRQHLIN